MVSDSNLAKELTNNKKDWLKAILVAVMTVLLMSIPYFLGYVFAKQGLAYTGLLMNPEDSQTYFAKMLQGYDGRLLYTIPFTPEPHDGAFVGVFYLWLGHLARLLGRALRGSAVHAGRGHVQRGSPGPGRATARARRERRTVAGR